MLDQAVSIITSRHHAFVQHVRRVTRGDSQLSVLDGWHLVGEAIEAGLVFEAVAVAADVESPDTQRWLGRLEQSHISVLRVSEAVLQALSPVRTPSGVVALVRQPAVADVDLTRDHPALVLVGVTMQDPGNVGATIRAADAGGATGVVLTGESASPWGWKALRAGMGSTFRLPVMRSADTAAVCAGLRAAGLQIVAAAPRAGLSLHDIDFRSPTAMLLGGEGLGLSSDLLDLADRAVSIPMRAPVESLNVAVAAGVLVYEARRQRTVTAAPTIGARR